VNTVVYVIVISVMSTQLCSTVDWYVNTIGTSSSLRDSYCRW